ncbi:TonB-dependent siderophore receptor [Chelatococcus sambhunathii]|uniref:TonB-dependent siderophore receptor n=1 Tax=Chelatococcus sambhunathii TaxID=363953 RepID=A0ABU1DBW8_9HYPH|nr:TonB-dependent siderophore receptor [Chelatococcus sambhunathii]MDR4305609.1 TonB-dependent siderophore receptor [Chelatococcus sambhunathii]
MATCLRFALAATVSILPLAAKSQEAGVTQLDTINVEGRGGNGTSGTPGVATSDGYVAKTTRTATKTDLPVHETPATINTVTAKQLQDRNPQNLQEALAYTPGVRGGAFGFDPRYDSFFVRGVDITYTGVFRDGLRQFNSPNGLFRLEPYGLESISILKGPASAIYGASASAGIIDLISKRPTDYKFGEVEVQGGSFERKQGNFDFGGPLNEEGGVSYRITALFRDAETGLGKAVKDDRAFIAPSITFKPSDKTKLTVLAEFMDATTGGSAAYNNNYGLLFDKHGKPIFGPDVDGDGNPDQLTGSYGANRHFGADARYNDFNQKQGRIGYEFEHEFNDRVSVRQNLRYSGLNTDQEYSFFDDFGGFSNGLVKERNRAFGVDSYLKTRFDTGPASHTLLTGVDVGHLTYNSQQGVGPYLAPPAEPLFMDPALTTFNRQTQTITGVYAQDEIKLDRWRLVIGGRHDWLESKFGQEFADVKKNGDPKVAKSTLYEDEGQFTGRAALSYVAPNGFTPYASYGTSFNANSGTVVNASVAKPTKGETAEAGLKYDVPGYNASINGSVFWLKQVDGVIFDVDSTGLNRQIQLDFRSRGFELDATASLANGLNLIASYSYTDTKILKLSQFTEGNEISGIPKHAFAVWAGYDFKSGPARGLSLGAGVRYTGQNFGDNLNRSVISNEARAFVDAKASYDFEYVAPKLKGVSLQVNASNLFDTVKQVCTSGYCYYDEGRKVIASVKYRW